MSLSRSEREWIPSATIAALRPRIPAIIFNIVKMMFTMAPTTVILRISCALLLIVPIVKRFVSVKLTK